MGRDDVRWSPGDLIVCETLAAITTHVRLLTTQGPLFEGASDSPPRALCGAKVAWDTLLPLSTVGCRNCIAELDRAQGRTP